MRRSSGMLARVAGAAALVLAALAPAEAHHSASSWGPFYRQRYLICDEHPWDRALCAGPNRAKQQILGAISGSDDDKAHDAAIAAVYFRMRDAIAPLQAILVTKPDPKDDGTHEEMELNSLRAEAAYALANLGDTSQAAEILALVQHFETKGHGTLWLDTLESLALIDPDRAAEYAIGIIDRERDWRTSMPGGSDKLAVLALVRPTDARRAATIVDRAAKREENGYDHAHCRLQALRVRIEPTLRAQVRKQFVASYSGTWLAGCANDVLPELGVDPEDADALVRHLGRDDRGMDFGMANIAYRRIIDLEIAMAAEWPSANGARRKLIETARAKLKKGLVARNRWPHVADPTSPNYALHFVAFHRAALAGLGDETARGQLWTLVDDPADHSGAAWIAAHNALKLELPGAVDHVAALIERGVTYANSERGDVYDDIRARTLDAFVTRAPTDPRWPVLLLDGSGPSLASERTLYLLSRLQPAGACDTVTAAARGADPYHVEFALLALTTYGTACLPAIEKLFGDATVPSEVRGVALEFTGVLGSPRLAENIARARTEKVFEPAIQRAEKWLPPGTAAPKRPPPRPTPPAKPGTPGKPALPPRTYKQGL